MAPEHACAACTGRGEGEHLVLLSDLGHPLFLAEDGVGDFEPELGNVSDLLCEQVHALGREPGRGGEDGPHGVIRQIVLVRAPRAVRAARTKQGLREGQPHLLSTLLKGGRSHGGKHFRGPTTEQRRAVRARA